MERAEDAHPPPVPSLAFERGPDALWRRTPAPHRERWQVMGVPLEIASNAPALLDVAERTLGRWPRCPAGEPPPPCRVDLYLHDVPGPSLPLSPVPLFRGQRGYFLLSHGGTIAFAHREAGYAAAFIDPDLLRDPAFVQVNIVECLCLYLVFLHRRAALHAAAVVSDGRCVLLTGHCGAGKSSLAYACLRAGMRLMADDAVYADGGSDPLLYWGNPWLLHLPSDTVRFFPELAGVDRVTELSGEVKYIVDVDAHRPGAAVTAARVEAVLSLGRAPGRCSALRRADPRRVVDTLTHFRDDVEADDRDAMLAAACRLVEGRTGHLDVGSDMEDAVACIRRSLQT